MAQDKARRVAKDRIKRTARESSDIATAPFLISPVTRPFAAPIRRLFPATVDAIVDSGLLDNAIDAKVAELAGRRGIPMEQPQPMSRGEQLVALVEVAKTLGTDPEVVEEAENLLVAAAPERGPRFSESIRRQFSAANFLLGIDPGEEPSKRTRKKTKTDKNMSKALAQANKELRKQNGELRKGKTQADVMRRAHRIRRKMS